MELPQEQVITVGGTQYRLSKLSLDILGEFLAWAKTQLPDPFDRFAERFGSLSESVQKLAFERAARIVEVRGTLHDPETNALMSSIPGVQKMFFLLFKKHQPNLSQEQVNEIVNQGVIEQGDSFLANFFPGVEKGDRPFTPKSRKRS